MTELSSRVFSEGRQQPSFYVCATCPAPFLTARQRGIYYGVKKAFPVLAVTVFMVLIAAKPDYFSASAARGLALFATSVLPAVFPFFFCSTFLTSVGAAKALSRLGAKPVRVLFNAPPEGAYALVMSMLSGYPVGAAVTADLYGREAIDGAAAKKISAFASTSGPAFVLGTVGGVLFRSAATGALLLLAHFLSALVVGVLFRGRSKKSSDRKKRLRRGCPSKGEKTDAETDCTENKAAVAASSATPSPPSPPRTLDTDTALGDSIRSSTLAMLAVGGYVVLGNMLVDALALTGLEHAVYSLLPHQWAQALLAIVFGSVEMTRGCVTAAAVSDLPLAAATSAACISFGGVSVMLQSHAFLSRCGVGLTSIFLRKTVQAAVSFGVAFLIFTIFEQLLS